jgi:hypothetical protein
VTLTDQTDPPVDGCDAPVRGPDDPGNGDDLLEIGETWVYTCSAVITEQTTNTAVATGTDILTSKVTKSDHHTVAPFTTGISVTKVAEQTSLTAPGGEVTYRYDVVNTGTVPLADVRDRIADDTCADVQYVSGDEDGNDLLTSEGDQFETGPAEVWRFTCTTNVSRDTTNTVTVTGTPVRPTPSGPEPLSPDVTGKDTATVRVVPPPTTPPGGTPGLPETGTDALRMTQLAVLLVALGALLALPWRRRRA